MAARCYLLASLGDAADREALIAVIRELEAMPEVLFAEPVVGAFDLVATLETREAVEDVVRRIQTIAGIESVTPLKVNPIPVRERMWKNLDKIPTRAG
jgi:ABC-type iron transport system FetAB ATPase subunit